RRCRTRPAGARAPLPPARLTTRGPGARAAAGRLPLPALFINIGGVANVTFVSAEADPLACDTGPGNALLDDLMLERTGDPCDRDGATARRGQVNAAALAQLMGHPFFAAPLPKSLDRNSFSRAPVAALATIDAAATLTAFTTASIARIGDHLPGPPAIAIVCGGGARNPALMAALAARLPCPVETAEAFGWASDAIEAQAFAYLAVRSRRGLPISFPGTTGVPRPLTGGRLTAPTA
ncbi:anhydro-N-acetylmuramic acid kinase, partial [Lichenihabitans sp. Uapishka_5]|uniref:anhydro-N-acetylmuramic acid kinase n=1 Tax=Lichenihabitans sp. Uapishka_5 TaxID=3037302 RepID=UPI0029E7D5DA